MPAKESVGGLLAMVVISLVVFMGVAWVLGRRGSLAERAPQKGRCKKCGETRELVHDMESPYSIERMGTPSVCFRCWHAGRWSRMRDWYRDVLVVAFAFVLPAATVVFWLFWRFYFRYQPQQGDGKRAFYLFLVLPTILIAASIPSVLVRKRLVSRYGPELELMSRPNREVSEILPIGLWLIFVVFGLVLFYLWYKRMDVVWW